MLVRCNRSALVTALWKASVEDLDKLTSMQLPLAKHPFEYNTASFALGLIAKVLECIDGLNNNGDSFGPNKMLAKLWSAVGYLQGMTDIGNPTEFILEQLE